MQTDREKGFAAMKKGQQNEVVQIPITDLKPFEEQPFKVLMDESMDELVDSVKMAGVMSPVIARPHKDGGYEILSGHRRVKASELAGKKKVPVIIKELDDDMAAILLVDSNLQRENILPSEKARAYLLKKTALERKLGRPSKEKEGQVVPNYFGKKTTEIIGEQSGESYKQVQRYIRLTELIDPLLEMVDERKIPLNAAVELSYLGSKAQFDVLESIGRNEAAPSIEQAAKIRRFAKDGKVNPDVIDSIMQEQKPEKLKITLKEDKLRKYFPKSYSNKQIEETIMKLIESWARKRKEPER